MINGINEISPILRDSLLRYNLGVASSVINYNPSGIGLPITMGNNYQVIDSPSLITVALRELKQLSYNLYNPIENNSLESINITPISEKTIEGGYYLNGSINGIKKNTYGQFINTISGSGLLDNIQYTTLTEFVGISLNLFDDTQLGKNSSTQLWKMIRYNTTNHVYKETAGKINLNLRSLLSGDDFLKGDYSITKQNKSSLVDVLDTALSTLGFKSPYLSLPNSASIFNYENKSATIGKSSTESLNNEIIRNTGNGTSALLKANLDANLDKTFNKGGNRYAPNYKINGEKISSVDTEYFNIVDSDTNSVFSDYTTLTSGDDTESGYSIKSGLNKIKTSEEDNLNFTDDNRFRTTEPFSIDYSTNKKTLLDKTQALFNKNKIKTILNDKGSTEIDNTELQSIHANEGRGFVGKAISKGSQFVYLDKLSGSESDPNNYFCRSWVNGYSYNQVNRLQKHRGLDSNIGLRRATDMSVLDTNGFVRYSPYKNDTSAITKKYMFSIENLAWANDLINLPEWEIGNGDPLTGTAGRIMWFPPYELNFSESTSSNIDTHNFIGRGEPVYTYNSTERVGTLDFKIIIDHPQYMNESNLKEFYGDMYDDALQSLIAGCGISDIIPESNLSEITKQAKDIEEAKEEEVKLINSQVGPEGFSIYFPNDVADLSGTTNMDIFDTWHLTETDLNGRYAWGMYELKGSKGSPSETSWKETRTEGFTPGITTQNKGNYPDAYNYGLNKKWRNKKFLNDLSEELKTKCPACKVFISGYASTDGKTGSNSTLSSTRAKNVANFLRATVLKDDPVDESIRFGASNETIIGKGETGVKDNSRQDTYAKKIARHVTVSFKPDLEVQNALAKEAGKEVGEAKNKLGKELKNLFYNESLYFERLSKTDKLTYDKLSERIKHFSPAFHSTTPEGFNSRLTFLQQCMRQGSTQAKDSNRPNNMAFGMPPVCILRIGDFYNCKVIFDSLSINYEQLWDVNPEGIGVQPLIANVSLSFKMLGGSSMLGPINKLQNAISFNYYANSEVFDPRADYFTKFEDGSEENTLDIKKDGEKVTQTTRYKGQYTNQINDLNLLIGGVYTSKDENATNSGVSEITNDQIFNPDTPIINGTSEGVISE